MAPISFGSVGYLKHVIMAADALEAKMVPEASYRLDLELACHVQFILWGFFETKSCYLAQIGL